MPPLRFGPVAPLALLGGGVAFPPDTYTNEQVLRLVGGGSRSEEHLAFAAAGVTKTLGLERRAWSRRPGEAAVAGSLDTPALAVLAARAALADAGLEPGALAAVLVATSTPHRMTGTVSAAVGAALGTDGLCQDVRAGCAGGLLALAQGALLSHVCGLPVMVVGVETFSGVLPLGHTNAALALGDGAAAIIVGPSASHGTNPATPSAGALISAWIRTDGALGGLVSTPGPLPPTVEAVAAGAYRLTGEAEELAAALPSRYAEAIDGALAQAGLGPADVDLFVPHQTSRPLIEALSRRLSLPTERVFSEGVARHANIGAAGALAALATCRAQGRLEPGTTALLAAVGGGMSWAALVLRC